MTLWPEANLGVVPPPGVIVLDFDPRNGAADTWRRLAGQHGPLPRTLAAQTGSGGLHVWLRHPARPRGALGPGIDVKSSTGYVVVPPSDHASGGRYEWAKPFNLIATAPGWLSELLVPTLSRGQRRAGAYRRVGTSTGLVAFMAEAPVGERNNRLMWATCRAHEEGADDGVLAALRYAAHAVGLSEVETARTMASAARTVVGTHD